MIEAHSIKGASLNVGTTALHEIALRLEKSQPQEDRMGTMVIYGELEEEYARVKAFIERYLAS